MTEKLKPCPFCGKRPKADVSVTWFGNPRNYGGNAWVRCRKCDYDLEVDATEQQVVDYINKVGPQSLKCEDACSGGGDCWGTHRGKCTRTDNLTGRSMHLISKELLRQVREKWNTRY